MELESPSKSAACTVGRDYNSTTALRHLDDAPNNGEALLDYNISLTVRRTGAPVTRDVAPNYQEQGDSSKLKIPLEKAPHSWSPFFVSTGKGLRTPHDLQRGE